MQYGSDTAQGSLWAPPCTNHTRLDPFAALIEAALSDSRRSAPVELIGFPVDAADWIGEDGAIAIPKRGYESRRWEEQESGVGSYESGIATQHP